MFGGIILKHIVFVIGNYKNGGVARRSTNIANEFAKAGYNCSILVTGEISKTLFFEVHENVKIEELKKYQETNQTKERFLSETKIEKKIRLLKKIHYLTSFCGNLSEKISTKVKILRNGKNLLPYVLLHKNSLYIPFGSFLLTSVCSAFNNKNAKIIYAEINAPEIDFPNKKATKTEYLKAVSKADYAIFQTDDEKAFFEGYIKKACVIHNPISDKLPEPYFGKRRKTIVNYCRIAEQKNLKLLIDAFIVFKKTNPDYTLEIYGNTVVENEKNELKRLIAYTKSVNAQDYVFFLKPRADVHSAVKDCAMFVSSSDFEGLSNSMLEAMAIGLPCVCTDCLGGGAREMITNGENGLLVPMNDVNALAQAMCRMAEDKELSEKCSKNAAKVRKTHAVETISEKWLEVINSII